MSCGFLFGLAYHQESFLCNVLLGSLVHKKDFAYECEETGDIVYDGYTLLRMIYMVVKPNVVIDVKDLQLKMEKMTIISADNTFHTLSTTLEELQQEINAEKGDDFCKDDKLLTELFHAAEATTNEAFALDIHKANNAWITGKQTVKNAIINDLNVLYRNMVAEGSWKKPVLRIPRSLPSPPRLRILRSNSKIMI